MYIKADKVPMKKGKDATLKDLRDSSNIGRTYTPGLKKGGVRVESGKQIQRRIQTNFSKLPKDERNVMTDILSKGKTKRSDNEIMKDILKETDKLFKSSGDLSKEDTKKLSALFDEYYNKRR